MQNKLKCINISQNNEYITIIFNLKNKKYLNNEVSIALDFSDGTVRIFDNNYHLKTVISLNNKIKGKNLKSIQKDGEYYSVVSMCIDKR